MKNVLTTLFAVAIVAGFSFPAFAEAKEIELTGELACGKCALGKTNSCSNILAVKKGDKTVYATLAKNDVVKGFHKEICAGEKVNVKVLGTVAHKGDKVIVTASKIGKAAAACGDSCEKECCTEKKAAPAAAKALEVTGDLVCGKCALGKTSSCSNVLVVEKEGKKHHVSLAKNSVSNDFHGNICSGDAVKVTIKGALKKTDDGHVLVAENIKKAG